MLQKYNFICYHLDFSSNYIYCSCTVVADIVCIFSVRKQQLTNPQCNRDITFASTDIAFLRWSGKRMAELHLGEVALVTKEAEGFSICLCLCSEIRMSVQKLFHTCNPHHKLIALPILKTLCQCQFWCQCVYKGVVRAPENWGSKLLSSSVEESTLHVRLVWSGVAKLLVESHIFGCTFQCDFIAIQLFAEKSECWN